MSGDRFDFKRYAVVVLADVYEMPPGHESFTAKMRRELEAKRSPERRRVAIEVVALDADEAVSKVELHLSQGIHREGPEDTYDGD